MTDFSSNWMTRRQEALETGLDGRLAGGHALQGIEAAVICSEWMSGSMTRIMADMADAQKATQSLLSPPKIETAEPAPVHQLREAA